MKNMHQDTHERLRMTLNGYSKRVGPLVKQKIQIENMYPETSIECWDLHHAEKWFELTCDIDAIREFEGL